MSEPRHHLHLATDEVNSFWLGEVEGKGFHQAFLRALSRPGEDPQGAAWQGEVGRGRTDVGGAWRACRSTLFGPAAQRKCVPTCYGVMKPREFRGYRHKLCSLSPRVLPRILGKREEV